MSDSSNNNPITEEEVLASRGFNSNIITLRGFTSYGYRDRSRDVLNAVDIWDLQLRIIIKDKAWRNHILFDYKQDRIPVLGSNGQSMLVNKDTHHYYDNQLLYLPIRLTGKRYHHVPESELEIFEEESKEEGVYWFGQIKGETPTSELLAKANPLMMQATHFFEEDHELNAKSEINNSPYNLENIEVYYRPIRQCNKWDCPLCQPVQRFVQAVNSSNKKAKDWFLIGLRFDDDESIKYDHLKSLEPLIKQFELLTKMIEVNQAIWNSWDEMDRLNN